MSKYLNPISSVTFISVGDGDSALIRLPFSQGVLLVDAYNSYDYLKTEGISKIDYLLLTHSDDDHTGDYKKILDNINVSYIIYPKYDNRFKELLKDYDNKIEVKSDTNLKFKNTNIKILGPVMDNETPNNNSIVFKIDIFNKTETASILRALYGSKGNYYENVFKYCCEGNGPRWPCGNAFRTRSQATRATWRSSTPRRCRSGHGFSGQTAAAARRPPATKL